MPERAVALAALRAAAGDANADAGVAAGVADTDDAGCAAAVGEPAEVAGVAGETSAAVAEVPGESPVTGFGTTSFFFGGFGGLAGLFFEAFPGGEELCAPAFFTGASAFFAGTAACGAGSADSTGEKLFFSWPGAT